MRGQLPPDWYIHHLVTTTPTQQYESDIYLNGNYNIKHVLWIVVQYTCIISYAGKVPDIRSVSPLCERLPGTGYYKYIKYQRTAATDLLRDYAPTYTSKVRASYPVCDLRLLYVMLSIRNVHHHTQATFPSNTVYRGLQQSKKQRK